MNAAQRLSDQIRNKTAHLSIVGMGYVGLPLALEFATAGFRVTGIDVDQERVAALRSGQSYIPDVSSEEFQVLLSDGRFQATSDSEVLQTVDTVSICVPTPLRKTKDPDLSHVMAAVEVMRALPWTPKGESM